MDDKKSSNISFASKNSLDKKIGWYKNNVSKKIGWYKNNVNVNNIKLILGDE